MGICISVASSEIHQAEDCQENIDSNGILRFGSLYSKQGSKGLNQDAAIFYQDYGMESGAFCGVFDGHGKNGHIVSNMVRNRLPTLLLNQKNVLANTKTTADDKNSQWKEACISAFKVMDKEIKLQENLDCSTSGSTGVVVVRQGEDLVIANLGDSRAILGTATENGIKAVQLTTDLKPGLPSEAERIRSCNGRIWDVLNNNQVASIVMEAESEQAAARAVVEAATASWKRKFPSSKVDDCTVVCLFLQNQKEQHHI
ncbi:phosphatase 2C (PP2C)-like protein [Corchorus capsularis]|uniref:Phosphatase 2C (PP2C)-like protein n=1 Tax=Corchorus capsularis TaxID=210143 RepID=A0A1R3KH74_COCAP|nr:phosphatase 2C (PP2C)-like protein [Corchorus capsularis]